MRKITSLIAILAMWMVGATALAQETGCLEELRLKTITIKGVAPEMVPNTWYLAANKHMAQEDYGFLFDRGVGENLYKGNSSSVVDGDAAMDKANYLIRFIPGEGQNPDEPAYYVQFGNGNYYAHGNNPDDYPTTTDSQDEATMWNVGIIEDTPGHFWFIEDSEDLTGQRIDNQGTNYYVVFWESGLTNPEYNSDHLLLDHNYDWQLYELELEDADEVQLLLQTVISRYTELLEQYDAFEAGTGHGQYPADKVKAFQDVLDNVGMTLDDPAFQPTIEGLQSMLDNMNKAYDELVKSQIILKFEPKNGYYFVKSGAGATFWHETVTTPETTDPETGEPVPGETIWLNPTKGMYTTSAKTGWKTIVDEEADLPFLYRVDLDEKTGNYQFKSMMTGGRLPKVVTSSDVKMDATLDPVESEISFKYIEKDSAGNIIVAIRRADQTGEYQYLHQGGHAGGEGKSGSVVGWEPSAPATHWYLTLVSDERAKEIIDAYAPILDHEKLVQQYDSLKALVMSEIPYAEDFVVDYDSPLITSADQFHSDCTEEYEGSIEALIDGDYSTYWHSRWNQGPVSVGTHFLSTYLPDGQENGIAMTYVRRNAAHDQTTIFTVYGSETQSLDESWTYLGEFNFPDLQINTVYTSSITFDGKWNYIHIASKESKVQSTGVLDNRGYWHAAEIQFYPVANNPKSQAATMGEVYKNLKAVLKAHGSLSSEDITPEIYAELKAAADAFHARFVNPRELRSAIADAKARTALVVEGSDPGCWSDVSGLAALTKTIGDAEAYDEACVYTKAQSDEYVKTITEGAEKIMASANKVREDKWYFIQFPSEEMYEEYQWDKAGAELKVNDDEQMTMEPLYGTVLALGKHRNGNGSDEAEKSKFVDIISADEAYQGTVLVVDNPNDLADEELAMFRFVNVGDSAYAMQNKATGLYVSMTGQVIVDQHADIHPTLFKVTPIGAGTNVLKAEDVSGKEYTYLHIAHDGSKVVSWDASSLGSNSALLIKEAADIDELPDGTFLKQVEPGKVYPMCYASSFKVTEGDAVIYNVKGMSEDLGTYSVVLSPIEESKPGQPVILIAGGEYESPAKGEDPAYEELTMQHGTEFAHDPLTGKCIIGNFNGDKAVKGTIVAKEDGFTATKTASTTIEARSAYLSYDKQPVEAGEGDVVIVVDGKVVSISEVVGKVAASGSIYTIDGRYMGKGNINDVRILGKGTYVVDGVKVMVK